MYSLRICRAHLLHVGTKRYSESGRRRDALCYDADVAVLSTALTNLLFLDGRSSPDSPDRLALLGYVGASRWLRFGVGVGADEAMPLDDDDGLTWAAEDFAQHWQSWMSYRRCVIEVSPPRTAPVRFRLDGGVGTPPAFPASTFAVMSGWNPGGEPRPNARANQRANERLAAHLDARMVERWPAVTAPGTRWREEGFAVLGLDVEEAWRIGEAFGQRAIYYVDRGTPMLVARRRGRVVRWEGTLTVA
jgi:hypothetical protein